MTTLGAITLLAVVITPVFIFGVIMTLFILANRKGPEDEE